MLVVLQPLFPGESGVDQLVEIIKVGYTWADIGGVVAAEAGFVYCLGDSGFGTVVSLSGRAGFMRYGLWFVSNKW